MLRLGEKQKLQVVRIVSFGVYLAESDEESTGIPEREGRYSTTGIESREWISEPESSRHSGAIPAEAAGRMGRQGRHSGAIPAEASGRMGRQGRHSGAIPAEAAGRVERQTRHSPKNISREKVLLPQKEVPEGVREGDELEVFLYRDSQDRLIATTAEPVLTLYHTAVLRVKQVSRVGAFLDWGLPKDLLLPFHEQTKKVTQGEECLVALYIDKSDRLCATMKVYHYLRKHSPYQTGDQVEGRVYEISGNFGVFVAVDDMYSALIPKQEEAGTFYVNEKISARVTQVKEDGKLNLSVRKKAYQQMDDDAEMVMKVIEEYAGVLPFSENASTEVIRRELGLTKNAFKRALGKLYKERRIVIGENRVYTIERAPEALKDRA